MMTNEGRDPELQGEVPSVSIIMGTYNAGNTLREAIDSIVAQTFTDWEFIICDDGSCDNSLQIAQEYAAHDPQRFRVLSNEQNMRLAATLNRCLKVARGRYIARMDADDISTPKRLAKQVQVLETNPDIDVVGTAMQRFDETGKRGVILPPERPKSSSLRTSVPFCHATILARQRMYALVEGYNEDARAERVEDLDLWFRFFAHSLVGVNLMEPLYWVREDREAFRRRTVRNRVNVFTARVAGFGRLGVPIHWYAYPLLELFKAVVPPGLQMLHRRRQDGPNVAGGA